MKLPTTILRKWTTPTKYIVIIIGVCYDGDMTKITLSYVAGFFDGEGSINILKRKRYRWAVEHNLMVAMGQKDGATLDWIKDNFGGNVYLVKRDGSYYWAISNRAAYDFLKKIYPYLQYKKPQAELAFSFYEGKKKSTRYYRVPKEELERREKIRDQIRELHKTIIKSRYAGTTTKRADPKGM